MHTGDIGWVVEFHNRHSEWKEEDEKSLCQATEVKRILHLGARRIGGTCTLPNNVGMFFMETNARLRELDGATLCALESAARTNPQRPVVPDETDDPTNIA